MEGKCFYFKQLVQQELRELILKANLQRTQNNTLFFSSTKVQIDNSLCVQENPSAFRQSEYKKGFTFHI